MSAAHTRGRPGEISMSPSPWMAWVCRRGASREVDTRKARRGDVGLRRAAPVPPAPANYSTIGQLSNCVDRGAGFRWQPNLTTRCQDRIKNWRGRDGNDPSVDIAKDADQRF